MEAHPAADPLRETRASTSSGWKTLLVLMVLVGIARWAIIARTEVAARDSIGFLRFAERLQNEPWTEVIRSSEQAPGYSIAILMVSAPSRALNPDIAPRTQVRWAQATSALFAVLAMIPIFLLGRDLGGARVGWLAALLFSVLPEWLRLTTDGLSEALFAFWTAWALFAAHRSFRRQDARLFLLAGLCAGAAYLTRPEGIEIVLAVGLVLLGGQCALSTRKPWARVATQGLALVMGLLIGLGPYVALTGRLSNKNTFKAIVGDSDVDPQGLLPQYGQRPVRTPLAAWLHESGSRSRWIWAIQALAKESAQSLQVYGLVLIAVGLLVLRKPEYRGQPILAVLAVLALLHAAILCRMASLSGYLSLRHTLYLMLVGIFPAAIGLDWLITRAQAFCAPRQPTIARLLPGVVAGLLALGIVPTLWKPMHANRAGHRAAGEWLAGNIRPKDAIIDPFNWAEFYAGRLQPRLDTARPERVFVVLEESDNQHSRLPEIPAAKAHAAIGQAVFTWPRSGLPQVRVYEVPGDKLPDPERMEVKPVYRVGLKAAMATAASPANQRGG